MDYDSLSAPLAEITIDRPIIKPIDPDLPRFDRFERMIVFLRQLPVQRFCFTRLRSVDAVCGTVGCAMGYSDMVFPELHITIGVHGTHFIIENRGISGMISHVNGVANHHEAYVPAAMLVFNISSQDAYLLFTARFSDVGKPTVRGVKRCGTLATPMQVAGMLEEYCASY